MNFDLTEEQQMLRKMVRDFAEAEVAPGALERDKTGQFPHDIVKKLADLELLGLPFPEEYGGAGGDTLSYAIAVEELSRACASTGITYAAHISLGASPFYLFGTKEQKEKWLTPMAKGQFLGAFGLTEPNAGSDAGGTRTTAHLEGDEWVINGSKCFITNALYSGAVTVTAVTDKSRGSRGISSIIVPKDTPGLTINCNYQKMGLNASNTCELFLEDVRVPRENILGQEGSGFRQFLEVLDGGRISIGAMALGIAQASLDKALQYSMEREQFGQAISKFQAIQFKLADMTTNIEMARLMIWKAAWLKDNKRKFSKEAAMAKLFASEIATKAALEAVQIMGGNGYMKEYEVERYVRDAKLCEIGEGTSEVQRLVIARLLGC